MWSTPISSRRSAGWTPGGSGGAALWCWLSRFPTKPKTLKTLICLGAGWGSLWLSCPQGRWGGCNRDRSVSWEFSRLCSFLQVALGSSWDFLWYLRKSQFRSCFGSFATYETRQILLLTVRDNWTPCPPPFLGNSFKRSLILLTNQAISFAKQLQGPCKSRRTAPLLNSAFW